MRITALAIVLSALSLSACSLQLPAGNDVHEPFFAKTYGY